MSFVTVECYRGQLEKRDGRAKRSKGTIDEQGASRRHKSATRHQQDLLACHRTGD